ncbi:MAG TPA: PsbP-related protein [Solirubrobacteraceae bacterium]|nr:PsbP-related protein [Solirubrobacteraceae bacterium]
MLSIKNGCALLLLIAPVAAGGCGSASSHTSTSSGGSAASGPAATSPSASSTTAASGSASPGALSGEAASTATGDIPDNQVFLVFHNNGAGYSIKYPEGWTQQGNAGDVTFKDKNNLVHIVISRGARPTPASVTVQLNGLKKSTPSLTFTSPHTMHISSSTAVKATYTTESAPNPVTGKRVSLMVDRYELAHNGRVAVVDLGTPIGVDNVDAYRMMIESFTWR